MFNKVLVEQLITDGSRLLEALRRKRFPLDAALWSYFPEPMEWRLVLVSPLVDRQGPRAAYTRIQRLLADINPSRLTLSDITVIGPSSDDYKNLRKTIGQLGRVPGSSAAHNTKRVILDDSYIYPLAAAPR